MKIKSKLIGFLLFTFNTLLFCQQKIESILPQIGTVGTRLQIIGKENWDTNIFVTIGNTPVSSFKINGKEINVTIPRECSSGAIEVRETISKEYYNLPDFEFKFCHTLSCFQIYSDYQCKYIKSNLNSKSFYIKGTGFNGLESVTIDGIEIKVHKGLYIITDEKAYIDISFIPKISTITLNNSMVSVTKEF